MPRGVDRVGALKGEKTVGCNFETCKTELNCVLLFCFLFLGQAFIQVYQTKPWKLIDHTRIKYHHHHCEFSMELKELLF